MSVDAVMDILREVSGPASESLSAGKRDFLLETTDLSEEDLSADSHEAARIQITEDRTLAEKKSWDSVLTTGEVAGLLGRQGSSSSAIETGR